MPSFETLYFGPKYNVLNIMFQRKQFNVKSTCVSIHHGADTVLERVVVGEGS